MYSCNLAASQIDTLLSDHSNGSMPFWLRQSTYLRPWTFSMTILGKKSCSEPIPARSLWHQTWHGGGWSWSQGRSTKPFCPKRKSCCRMKTIVRRVMMRYVKCSCRVCMWVVASRMLNKGPKAWILQYSYISLVHLSLYPEKQYRRSLRIPTNLTLECGSMCIIMCFLFIGYTTAV